MNELIKIPKPVARFPRVGVSSDQGLLQWISSVDHKMIGIMYLLVFVIFYDWRC